MRMGAYTTNPTSTEDGEFVFGHDYMSRRVSKQVPSWDAALNDGEGDWHPTLVLDQRYVYDGWNVVLVLDGLNDNAVVRKYSWGLDLSGQAGDASPSGIHGAGGIGGLLAAVETSGTHAGSYWYLYDANGNVGQVLNVTDPQSITPAAHYEYDPYGNRVAQSGTYADYNPFRFSTKWRDDETDLYYYGYRYYSPGLGRWISRDPIGEEGDLALHIFVKNQPIQLIDAQGQLAIFPLAFGYAAWGANCICCGKELEPALRNAMALRHSDPRFSKLNEDEWDAVEHCMGGCYSSRACGWKCSKLLGEGLELKQGESRSEQLKDLFNNKVGRDLGISSYEDCPRACLGELKKGNLALQ